MLAISNLTLYHINVIIFLLFGSVTCWTQFSRVKLQKDTFHHYLQVSKKPISKDMELAIKMKRLKQLKKEGKDYKAFITENARIDQEKEGKSDEEKAELQNKIVEYKEKVEHERRDKGLGQINALFLPDVGMKEVDKGFYRSLIEEATSSEKIKVSVLDMPDIHAFNTKRYEIEWMTYMRNSQPPLSSFDIIIAHGTSADAMLRYIESDRIQNLLLIDGSHIYTAGERHGRDYHYSLIKKNVQQIGLLATSTKSRLNDQRALQEGLRLDPNFVVNIEEDKTGNDTAETIRILAANLACDSFPKN